MRKFLDLEIVNVNDRVLINSKNGEFYVWEILVKSLNKENIINTNFDNKFEYLTLFFMVTPYRMTIKRW